MKKYTIYEDEHYFSIHISGPFNSDFSMTYLDSEDMAECFEDIWWDVYVYGGDYDDTFIKETKYDPKKWGFRIPKKDKKRLYKLYIRDWTEAHK